MDIQLIQQQLSPLSRELFAEIQLHEEIDSTNADALRQLKTGKQGNWIVLAKSQSAGRGRRGREWLSPKNGGVYLSLVRSFELPANSLQALSLVTALSLRQALEKLGIKQLRLKWPNDILYKKKKLAGILLELKQSGDSCHLVFGVGINMNLPAATVQAIERAVTDIAAISEEQGAAGSIADGNSIVAELANELSANLELYQQHGFAPFRDRWNQADCYLDCDIVIQSGETRTIGKSLGVDESGALILQSATGTHSIHGGVVFPSVRELADEAEL